MTPSYNQGEFLEATIRSVLLQGYPNLEYIIIDGGSSDQSVELIRKYESWLADWISEPDAGQADAINKGFARATGEIFGWLNSDDLYEPNALHHVGTHFHRNPACLLLYGNGWHLNEAGRKTTPCQWIKPYDRNLLLTFNFILQPAAFWRRALWEETGGLNISCHWAMDWEWLLRATALARPDYLPVALAAWRIRPEIKTLSGGWRRRTEIAAISRQYGGEWQPTYLVYRMDWLAQRLLDQPVYKTVGYPLHYLIRGVRWTLQQTIWRQRCLY